LTRVSGRSVLLWTGVAVTAFFTYLALRDARLSEVKGAFLDSEKGWLVPAFVVLAAAVFVRAVRWRSLYAPERRPPLGAVTGALLLGYFFNNVLPLRAGEVARVVALNRAAGTSRVESAAIVVLERAYDLVTLLVLLFVILPWLPDVGWLRAAAVLLGVLLVGVTAAAAVLARFGTRPFELVLRPLARVVGPERAEWGALNLGRGLTGLRRPRIALGAAFWTVLSWLLVGFSAWLVLLGFDLGLSPLAGLFVVITTNLALVLPSSPAAIGVFEAATLLALDAYGVTRSEALSYALVLHALNFLPFIVAGVVMLRLHLVSTR
jgi:glycosyltransferase 2 family protein